MAVRAVEHAPGCATFNRGTAMKDRLWLRALKLPALLNHRVNRIALGALGHLARRRSHRLAGECRRSGCCCEAPALRVAAPVWRSPVLVRLFLEWQRRVNGFELRSRDSAAHVFVFRCTHFDRQTRRCDSYASRPGFCRDYPRVLLAQPCPELLPGCGYRLVAPNAEGLRRALRAQPLTDEQRVRLQRELHLEE
jgi:uncharacterized protein